MEFTKTRGARDAVNGFHSAVSTSMPRICQPSTGELCNDVELTVMFSSVEAMQGLLEDMQDATMALGLDEEGWDDFAKCELGDDAVDDSQRQPTPKKRMGLRQVLKTIKVKFQRHGPSRWYERLAAKVFAIGVNYMQGWIVLQTLISEARRRDLAMPKFPLF